ncbi:MAG: YjjG family noncanonical pyrimidine nucleotidase [Clostridia bacterium]|nr:YjjG family noncanonical pyrimidine nucleotidase [Clostridia bacterium]
MKYTTLLMDADDTIFDFPKCEYAALKNSLTDCGYTFSDEICSRFSSINAALWKKFERGEITRADLRIRRFRELIEQCFQQCFPGTAEGRSDCETAANQYVKRLSEQAILIDGALEALDALSKKYEIYIITNGLKPVQEGRFAIAGLDRFVRRAYISDAMGVQKPSAEYFAMVLDDIPEKDRSKILVVGDSLTSDMKGGRNAGLDTCLYDPHLRVDMPDELCDYRIRDLNELLYF